MDSRVLKTVQYLEEHSSSEMRIRELARRVGLAESRLQHLFKADVALTIRQFVCRQRLRRAAELLAATDERVSQICFAVGYRDASNFDHAFRRTFGLSPTEFRRRAQAAPGDHSPPCLATLPRAAVRTDEFLGR